MAIAFDALSHATLNSESSKTFAHTCAASAILFVHLGAGAVGASVSTVKYNGVLMTLGKAETGSGGSFYAEVYYSLTPTSGTHDIELIMSGNEDVEVVGSSYTGVASLGTWNSFGNATGTDHTVDIASIVGDTVVDFAFLSDETADITPGAGQTERYDQTGTHRLWSSTEAGATTVTMSWTDGGGRYDQIGVSMTPSVVVPDTTIMKGVGQAG